MPSTTTTPELPTTEAIFDLESIVYLAFEQAEQLENDLIAAVDSGGASLDDADFAHMHVSLTGALSWAKDIVEKLERIRDDYLHTLGLEGFGRNPDITAAVIRLAEQRKASEGDDA